MEQADWFRKQFKSNFQSWYVEKKIQDVVDDRILKNEKITKFLEEKTKEHSRQLALETDSGLSAIEQHTKKTLAKYMKDEEFVDIMKFQFTDIKHDLTKHVDAKIKRTNTKIKRTNERIDKLEEWKKDTTSQYEYAWLTGFACFGAGLTLYRYIKDSR